MFKSAVRIAAVAARSTIRPKPTVAFRALSTTPRVASAHGPAPPQLYGAGGKAGEVPSDIDQATGLERLQLLGEMEGIDVFDPSPLDSSRIGTKANPIMVPSYDVERLIGCTGSPADSHDVHWYNLEKDKNIRCVECGSVYALDVSEGPLPERQFE
ncbi:cytochrome c oxidase polypeptide IV [Collybia nuda]|uniref:Cytochrome c oxidase polypeptide IV n=1 Tax=Collybia nuda TaxID=64659 RepID=A0A9P5YGC1_9AGAR|nr:cytochrome c oxidase polypeptide IV [Collybia nuda]